MYGLWPKNNVIAIIISKEYVADDDRVQTDNENTYTTRSAHRI